MLSSRLCRLVFVLILSELGVAVVGTPIGWSDTRVVVQHTRTGVFLRPVKLRSRYDVHFTSNARRVETSQQFEGLPSGPDPTQSLEISRLDLGLVWTFEDQRVNKESFAAIRQRFDQLVANSESDAQPTGKSDSALRPWPVPIKLTGQTKTLLGFNCQEILAKQSQTIDDPIVKGGKLDLELRAWIALGTGAEADWSKFRTDFLKQCGIDPCVPAKSTAALELWGLWRTNAVGQILDSHAGFPLQISYHIRGRSPESGELLDILADEYEVMSIEVEPTMAGRYEHPGGSGKDD